MPEDIEQHCTGFPNSIQSTLLIFYFIGSSFYYYYLVRRQFAMSVLSLTAEAIPSLCNLVDPPAAGYSPVLQVNT